MKKVIIKKTLCALALAAIGGCVAFTFIGCRTVSVQKTPDGWSVLAMSNMMKSELDGMETTISPDGSVSWKMGGLSSQPSEEFAKSLMTATYIARIAAAMYNPAAASVPLTEQAADPSAVAALVKAQADANAATIKAQANTSTNSVQATKK